MMKEIYQIVKNMYLGKKSLFGALLRNNYITFKE